MAENVAAKKPGEITCSDFVYAAKGRKDDRNIHK